MKAGFSARFLSYEANISTEILFSYIHWHKMFKNCFYKSGAFIECVVMGSDSIKAIPTVCLGFIDPAKPYSSSRVDPQHYQPKFRLSTGGDPDFQFPDLPSHLPESEQVAVSNRYQQCQELYAKANPPEKDPYAHMAPQDLAVQNEQLQQIVGKASLPVQDRTFPFIANTNFPTPGGDPKLSLNLGIEPAGMGPSVSMETFSGTRFNATAIIGPSNASAGAYLEVPISKKTTLNVGGNVNDQGEATTGFRLTRQF